MSRTYLLMACILLMSEVATACETAEVHLNSVAVTESGAHLARGTFRLVSKAEGLEAPDRSTIGQSPEPAPMYMLISYVFSPAPALLRFYPFEGTVVTELGEWNARARMVIDGCEPVAGPAGTFPKALKHATVITNAQADSDVARAFVNGSRYLWFAKGVGLVRMRYEHENGMVTEAVLLSYEALGDSDDYLPLQVGNRWTYAWKNGYRTEAVIETCTVGDRPADIREAARPRRERPEDEPKVEAVDSGSVKLDLAADKLLKIGSAPAKGFNFPYYLFVPHTIDPKVSLRLLVEMNNTGTTSDDLDVHDRKAKGLAQRSHANRIARKLNVPLLVPVFPRPREQWRIYTHSLDEDTLLVKSGPLKRIDLQLIEMIRDAQALLRRNSIQVRDKVFMHGFSASGTFTNRFPILHPHVVRAVAAGGVNAIPTFPTARWRGTDLPYPVGIADLQQIADIDFDDHAYKQVAQYIYMGYLDRNDTTLSRDTFCEDHAQLIRTLIGADMGERWTVSQSIYRELGVPAECVTYNGTAHSIRSEMIDDIVAFFQANAEEGFVRIEPHEYPFVEFKEIRVAHINGLYWAGDERIPEFARDLFSGKGHFIITIDEWMEGQDHQQLNAFRDHVVFEFVLTTDAHEDIRVTGDTFEGTCSWGDGRFQGFVVGLPASELSKIVRGIKYTITPVNQGKEYYWQVKEGVSLVRP